MVTALGCHLKKTYYTGAASAKTVVAVKQSSGISIGKTDAQIPVTALKSQRFGARSSIPIPILPLLIRNLSHGLVALSLSSMDPDHTLSTLLMCTNCSGAVPFISTALSIDGRWGHLLLQYPIGPPPGNTYRGFRGTRFLSSSILSVQQWAIHHHLQRGW